MYNPVTLVCLMVVLGGCKKDITTTEVSINFTLLQRNISPISHEDEPGEDDHTNKEDDDHTDPDHTDTDHPPPGYLTWLAASGSIFLISMCGIFGVLVIPIMQKLFYQHLLQFLIALAVGTLTGDALLHLLPHALLPEEHGHPDHQFHDLHSRAVWLGFMATVGMMGFFFLEKCINMVGEMKTGKEQKQVMEEKENSVRVVREGHEVSEKAKEKCMNKYSSYCVTDFNPEQQGGGGADEEVGVKEDGGEDGLCKRVGGGKSKNNSVGVADKAEEQDIVIISQHEVVHHGHSHAHSHLHSAPKSISSVAWMVIMGDGVHNLADGLAIGAAFASGFMSGVSTSVAVLCHELPHEIGDFAMLMKAGMTIKQAIFYNIISSVLSFMGMVIGLLLGTISDVTPWIFSITAGIFLYVALVDMVPELSSGHAHPISKDRQGEGHWVGVMLQVLGMAMGVSIMLVIALYEHKMVEMFSGEGGSHNH